MRGSAIEAVSVAAHQDRAFVAFADRQVDRACRAGHERDHRGLVALADDPQRAVAALEAEVLDVGGARFCDPQSVETEQHGERGVGVVVVLGGEQECARARRGPCRDVGGLHLGSAHVLGGVGAMRPSM